MTHSRAKAIETTERLGPGSPTWQAHSASHIARYQFVAEHVKGHRVLDAGTGLGYGAVILKAAGAAAVQAIDIDARSIEQASATYQFDALEFLVDDCESLTKVRGPFDVICNFENIEHLKSPEAFLARAAQLVADDGVMFCSTPERASSDWVDGRPLNPYHVIEWYRHEFRDLVSRFFDDVEIRVQVESLWALRRREARDNLNKHLLHLWGSPPVRLGRLMDRLLGRRQSWPLIDGLAAPSPADYPIVPEAIATIMGGDLTMSAGASSVANVAICRRPRR
jgi:SAM-dependent methyltransferase